MFTSLRNQRMANLISKNQTAFLFSILAQAAFSAEKSFSAIAFDAALILSPNCAPRDNPLPDDRYCIGIHHLGFWVFVNFTVDWVSFWIALFLGGCNILVDFVMHEGDCQMRMEAVDRWVYDS
jgi:hypothetical protein